MDFDSIIRKSKKEILSDDNLLSVYVQEYRRIFGNTPNCTSCSFNSDFNKLKKYYKKPSKQNSMKTNKVKTKYNDKILTYKKDRTVHLFGKRLSDEDALNFIEYGVSPKKKEDREAIFAVLPKENVKGNPEENKKKKEDKEVLNGKTKKELLKLADKLNIGVNQSQNKAEIIKAIENVKG